MGDGSIGKALYVLSLNRVWGAKAGYEIAICELLEPSQAHKKSVLLAGIRKLQTGPTGTNPGLELKIAGMLNDYHSINGAAAWYRVPVGKWDIGQVVEEIPEFAIPFGY